MKYRRLQTGFSKEATIVQVLLIIVIIGFLSLLKISFDASNQSAGLATLALNFEEKRVFEGEVIENMTILDALNVSVSTGQIKLNYSLDSKDNASVYEINGHINSTGGKLFRFYLNDKEIAEKNLTRTRVKSGDKIEITFQ